MLQIFCKYSIVIQKLLRSYTVDRKQKALKIVQIHILTLTNDQCYNIQAMVYCVVAIIFSKSGWVKSLEKKV